MDMFAHTLAGNENSKQRATPAQRKPGVIDKAYTCQCQVTKRKGYYKKKKKNYFASDSPACEDSSYKTSLRRDLPSYVHFGPFSWPLGHFLQAYTSLLWRITIC